MSSSDRFGYEWNKYSAMDQNYELQFKNWIYPLDKCDFNNLEILDAGCGMGRNSVWPLKWGAKRITAFDFDHRSVKRAKENLSVYPNAEVLFKSIYEMDWTRRFDLVFSIGVIHHLEYPKKALENLVRSLKTGGIIVVWVYGLEGNEWIVKYVNPIRKLITSRLPLPAVHFLSYFVSIPLFLFTRIFKGPSPYFRQISGFSLRHINSIVFDQLIPRVANYWSNQEVGNLFSDLGLRDLKIILPPNKMGWTIIAKKE